VSPAVRLCHLAYESGIDLTGAVFSLGGEPLTEARRATIERVGAAISLHYGTTEAGNVGRGCLAPEAADDVHFGHDRLAVIQPGPDSAAPFPPNATLLTSLYRHARLVLINVSLGDQAYVTQRACGCPMAELGWTTHLHSIRSYEKLTAGGMTFFDTDVMRVLDEALPARFGGSPTDYQLIDEELPDGRPGLRLLVNPRLGSLNETVIRDVFLAEIARTSATEAVMTRVWRDAGLPIVERAAAHPTPGGKVQHVHRAQQARVAVAR
jgi:phenylacetate-coenzyme A ligase PaaK-like adenylate-forming protein